MRLMCLCHVTNTCNFLLCSREDCLLIIELLKRFQSCRSHLGGTLQRAEQTISEQVSYRGKDNLQRLFARVCTGALLHTYTVVHCYSAVDGSLNHIMSQISIFFFSFEQIILCHTRHKMYFLFSYINCLNYRLIIF